MCKRVMISGSRAEIVQKIGRGIIFLLLFPHFQYLAACIVSGVASLSIGTVLGFSAILLPQLESEGHIEAKSQESSWIGKSAATRLLANYDPVIS